MKTAIATALITLATIFPTSVLAANDHAGHGAMHGSKAAGVAMSDGMVKKVDKTGGKVTIAHGPLENLAMPAMTMVFRVKDKAWLGQMNDGDRIRFMAEEVQGSLTVVKLDKAK
jgi:Cu/Ag efflux protein CusF